MRSREVPLNFEYRTKLHISCRALLFNSYGEDKARPTAVAAWTFEPVPLSIIIIHRFLVFGLLPRARAGSGTAGFIRQVQCLQPITCSRPSCPKSTCLKTLLISSQTADLWPNFSLVRLLCSSPIHSSPQFPPVLSLSTNSEWCCHFHSHRHAEFLRQGQVPSSSAYVLLTISSCTR